MSETLDLADCKFHVKQATYNLCAFHVKLSPTWNLEL